MHLAGFLDSIHALFCLHGKQGLFFDQGMLCPGNDLAWANRGRRQFDQGIKFGAFTGSSVHLNRSIILTAQFENLDRVREFVAESAEECGLEPAAVYAVQLAVDEAFTNIIEHAYEGVAGGEFTVACEMRGDSIEIVMRDNGMPFDVSAVKQPDLKADLSERQIGGLGVYLIRKIMDDVQYESNASTGNLLTMTKRKG